MKNNLPFQIKIFNAISQSLNLTYQAKIVEDGFDYVASIGCYTGPQKKSYHELFGVYKLDNEEKYNLIMFVDNHGSYHEPPSSDEIDKGIFDSLSEMFKIIIDILVQDAINNISESIYQETIQTDNL